MDVERQDKGVPERAAERKLDYLRSHHVKLTVGGSALILSVVTLLYFAGDIINGYINVAWIGLIVILIFAFFPAKYFYLICLTDDYDY